MSDDDDVCNNYFDALAESFGKYRFHLEGTDSGTFFIGLKTNGLGEVSYYDKEKDQYRSHFFDMKLFISNVENEIQRIKNEIEISG